MWQHRDRRIAELASAEASAELGLALVQETVQARGLGQVRVDQALGLALEGQHMIRKGYRSCTSCHLCL